MKTYVISLKRRADRRQALEPQLELGGYDWEWFDAWDAADYPRVSDLTTASRGQPCQPFFESWDGLSNKEAQQSLNKRWTAKLGCIESHYSVWRKFIISGESHCCVLEDDINIKLRAEFLPRPEFGITCISSRAYWANDTGPNGTCGYVISRATAVKLLDEMDVCLPNRLHWRTEPSPDCGLRAMRLAGIITPDVSDKPFVIPADFGSDIESPPQSINDGISANDLHIHLQNLANQGKLVLKIACTDTEAVKIGFWNDCIVLDRNENILTFFKRTPAMPERPWQEDFVKSLPTITTAVKDLPAVDPEGNVITDISGYMLDVTKFDNRRR